MCKACGTTEEKEQYRKECLIMENRLEKLSFDYRKMGKNIIKPHTEEIKNIEYSARDIIRKLVEEWI